MAQVQVKYHKSVESELKKGSRAVVPWNEGIVFRCPCDERQIYVASPPHKIEFDDEGLLTLDGSVGSRKQLRLPSEDMDSEDWKHRAKNWCHFWIKGGVLEMCSGTKCPGG